MPFITTKEMNKYIRERDKLLKVIDLKKALHRKAMGAVDDTWDGVCYAHEDLKDFLQGTMMTWEERLNAVATPQVQISTVQGSTRRRPSAAKPVSKQKAVASK